MWKKKLNNPTQISAIVSRAIHSSSISVSSRSNSSILNPRSLISSPFSASCSLGKLEGKPVPSTQEKCHCWNCGAEAENATSFLFCQACRTVQPVDKSIDYFHIFGLGRKYKIEVEALEKKYKDWQKKLHPDLVHSKTPREREYAAEQSARVIDAYRTLADPLLRAIYIVKLEGVPVDEEERVTDPELLSEVLELREAVDEAEDAEALKKIQGQLQDKLLYWSNSFEDAYLRKDYQDALASIRRMTYYRRANEEIVKKS